MQMEGRTDWHTDMMNLIAPFRNFARAPERSLTVQSDFLPLFEANNLRKSDEVSVTFRWSDKRWRLDIAFSLGQHCKFCCLIGWNVRVIITFEIYERLSLMATCKRHILVYRNRTKVCYFNESFEFVHCLSMLDDIRGVVYSKNKSKLFK